MKADPPKAGFTGISAKAFTFLKALAANQDREWFEAHKRDYERDVKMPLAALVTSLGLALAAQGIELGGDPKRAVFRIHRDVRFSKDKSPYKTNAGAALTRDGDKMSPGLLYIHIAVDGCFTAAGFYQPEPAKLAAIRQRIAARPKAFLDILSGLQKHGLTLSGEDALKRVPGGFEAVTAPEVLALLKLKSFILRRDLSHKLLADGDALIAGLVAFAVQAEPLLRFGWAA